MEHQGNVGGYGKSGWVDKEQDGKGIDAGDGGWRPTMLPVSGRGRAKPQERKLGQQHRAGEEGITRTGNLELRRVGVILGAREAAGPPGHGREGMNRQKCSALE